MKKVLLILFLMFIPFSVNADSGFDSNYNSNSSGSDAIGSLTSVASPVLNLIGSDPSQADYESNHLILGIICIIVFYIFTNIYLFKLNDKKKKAIVILGISLIPTILFGLFCLLTNLILILYAVILVIYIIIFKIVTSKKLKKRFNQNMELVKEKDKKFGIEKLNEETFDIYKKIQLAWMNFELNKVKNLISEEIYEKYQKQLDKLKKDNQKNMMENIEFKSNKIANIKLEDNIETIDLNMNITCFDYVVDNEENVIKGKKDKVKDYTYLLVFQKDIKTNKYTLVKKKMLKQK